MLTIPFITRNTCFKVSRVNAHFFTLGIELLYVICGFLFQKNGYINACALTIIVYH